MEYSSFVFDRAPLLQEVAAADIVIFSWERPGFSRPVSAARLWGIAGKGIYTRLWSYESNLLARCEGRDGEVWKDSCLELFLAPVKDDKRYMNFEMNPNGAFLCQFGEKREGRVFIKELTDIAPAVMPFRFGFNNMNAWGCEIFIPDELISALYSVDFVTDENEMRGNFYKCADDSPAPHFGSHFPVGSETLGFHNPDCFGKIILKKYLPKG